MPQSGGWPTLIQWTAGTHPSTRLPDSGVRLTRLDNLHPNAKGLAARLPMSDERLAFHTAATPALRATFSTPLGERVLE